MINFPVAGGTSGHLVGGALAAIILGPWAAIIVMTAVVGLQALLFQDGGLVVLGVNLVMMSIVSCHFRVWRLLRRLGRLVESRLERLLSGVVSSAHGSQLWWRPLLRHLPLAFSGTSPLSLALPALAAVHALIGIGEGLITVFALSFIRVARPQLLQVRRGSPVQLAEGV